MWLFCKSGFFSAVQERDDLGRVLVRSRFQGDIERLFPAAKVIHTPDADYPCRAFVPRMDWAAAVLSQAEGIDYENFKDAVNDGTRRDAAYMSDWGAMRRAQDGRGASMESCR